MIFTMPLCFFTLFLVMVVILYRSFSSSPKKKGSNQPPSPPALPIIGNFHQISNLSHISLQALSRRYGHVMLLKFGSIPTVVVSSAEAAEEVMKTHDLSFASRAPSVMGDILMYGCRDISFSPYGEYWRQVRRICVLNLLNAKQVRSFNHIMEEEVSSMVHKIRLASEGRVNLSELLVSLTNNILSRVALGRKYIKEEEGSNKYGDLVTEFMNLLGAFPLGDYIPSLAWVDNLSGILRRARRNAREIDIFLEHVLDDHLQNKEAPASHQVKCIVDILLSLGEEGNVDIPLTRDNIKAIILDMFVAGTHTTSSTMEWIMAELKRHPPKLKKVQEEVRKKVKWKTSYITEEDISEMVYFKAAIKETLRLHPPGPLLLPREAIQSSKLCGYDIPAKTKVLVNVWAMGRDLKYWDRPDEFIPERFIGSPVDYKGLDFQFLPFGAGRRGCPGISFGVMIVEIALANLLYHFNWDMQHGIESEEMDMTEMAGIALRKKSNLILLATPHDF